MITKLFYIHGEFCANHPWEVIMGTLTITTFTITLEHRYSISSKESSSQDCIDCINELQNNAVNVIFMTLMRSLAVLYSYYRIRDLNKRKSKYILSVCGIFVVISALAYILIIINWLRLDIFDFNDALFFFFLLTDISRIEKMAEITLSGSDKDVKKNIAKGISVLAPSLTLDSFVETLVISVGILSGVHRLEVVSYIASLSVIVNYIIFMTFYPALLSLILELTRKTKFEENGGFSVKSIKDIQKPNPVIRRIKFIMAAGLVLVHTYRQLFVKEYGIKSVAVEHNNTAHTEGTGFHENFIKWMVVSSDHIVLLILLAVLSAKFLLFEHEERSSNRVQSLQDNIDGNTNGSTAQLQITPALPSKPIFFLQQDEDEDLRDDKGTQTELEYHDADTDRYHTEMVRSLDECLRIYRSNLLASSLTDDEIVLLVMNKYITPYQIEKAVDSADRGVRIRRRLFAKESIFDEAFNNLPYKNYDYSKVMGACCENVIGYVPIPVGMVGPLRLDDHTIYVPLATTEGCLVASTNRGSRAVSKYGITSRIVADGMTRGPVVRFQSITEASEAMSWLELEQNFNLIKDSFDSSSRFARLLKIRTRIAGRCLFIRFVAKTGDAMGMNMLSKGTEVSLKLMQTYFPKMDILSLSGNFCADKKPAAVNWIEGRGKSVVCEAVVPANTVTSILKTTVQSMIDVNISKNMIGSAIAGSIGGFNAHAANLVTAIFIATGQDPAQNVSSSNCMTIMEPWGQNGEDLYISCTMPSIEVGTVGGGTVLPAQAACLEILGIKGPNEKYPGENANQLARIICGTVLVGELSLMAALSAGHLVKSHLRHNRSSTAICKDFSNNIPKFFTQK